MNIISAELESVPTFILDPGIILIPNCMRTFPGARNTSKPSRELLPPTDKKSNHNRNSVAIYISIHSI